jgi:hypothetical protein
MVTSRRGNHLLTKVAELIDPLTYSWDTQLIQQTFNEEDALAILQITIQEGAEDIIAWHFYKKWNFSVKSAYQVVVNSQESNPDRSSLCTGPYHCHLKFCTSCGVSQITAFHLG